MKKTLIAGAGVAAFGLAALPFTGVFAATGTSFSDSLMVTVEPGCTMETNTSTPGTYRDHTYEGSLEIGNSTELNAGGTAGNTLTITCNSTSGTWTVSVSATQANLVGGTTSNYIAPLVNGNSLDGGNTSAWAIKSNATNVAQGSSDAYASYKGYAAGTFLTGNAGATTPTTFNPSYKIYAAPGQAPDLYTNTITYSIDL